MIKNLITHLGLTVTRQMKSGHKCKHIYRVLDSANRLLVLKAADDATGMEEIRCNILGYEKLKSIDLQFFVPEVLSYVLSGELSYILMQDCGDDLIARFRDGDVDQSIYEQITAGMFQVYVKSLSSGNEASQHVAFEMQTILALYQNFFLPEFGCSETDRTIGRVREKVLKLDMPKFCFASWDFMPGNIFVTENGLKFIDPTATVTGMPILDLACLGGVLRDVYHFPGAAYGVTHFRKFALTTLARLLSVSDADSLRLYLLGRLVQNLLSLRECSTGNDTMGRQFFARNVNMCLKQIRALC